MALTFTDGAQRRQIYATRARLRLDSGSHADGQLTTRQISNERRILLLLQLQCEGMCINIIVFDAFNL